MYLFDNERCILRHKHKRHNIIPGAGYIFQYIKLKVG